MARKYGHVRDRYSCNLNIFYHLFLKSLGMDTYGYSLWAAYSLYPVATVTQKTCLPNMYLHVGHLRSNTLHLHRYYCELWLVPYFGHSLPKYNVNKYSSYKAKSAHWKLGAMIPNMKPWWRNEISFVFIEFMYLNNEFGKMQSMGFLKCASEQI